MNIYPVFGIRHEDDSLVASPIDEVKGFIL
jgi:hypothetical protein